MQLEERSHLNIDWVFSSSLQRVRPVLSCCKHLIRLVDFVWKNPINLTAAVSLFGWSL